MVPRFLSYLLYMMTITCFIMILLGSEAHVIMLHEAGVLSKNELIKILKSMDSLLKDASLLKEFGNSDSEDIHELVESAIVKMTDMDSGGKMHTADPETIRWF